MTNGFYSLTPLLIPGLEEVMDKQDAERLLEDVEEVAWCIVVWTRRAKEAHKRLTAYLRGVIKHGKPGRPAAR